jgi:hypothetical protein
MSQAHRDKLKEAEKKRHEYLRKTVQNGLGMMVGGGVVMCGFGMALFMILATGNIGFSVARTVCFSAFALAGIGFSIYGGRMVALSVRVAQAIPYVPPVAKQIATLSADEVLVRGSDQPAITPEELLIAADARMETASEELLRAGQESA